MFQRALPYYLFLKLRPCHCPQRLYDDISLVFNLIYQIIYLDFTLYRIMPASNYGEDFDEEVIPQHRVRRKLIAPP